MVVVILLALTVLVELALYHPFVWRLHRSVAVILAIGVAIATGYGAARGSGVILWLLLFLNIARITNLLRLVVSRRDDTQLRHLTFRSSRDLCALQVMVLVLLFIQWPPVSGNGVVFAIGGVQLLVAVCLCVVTFWNLRKTHFVPDAEYFSDHDLPSISVCIPARNETAMLEECLRSVLASDYPKLEVLVLDDDSHDKTPEIIRSFAHDGVRFVQGSHPDNHWLAKNKAYERLASEASGEIILFCGVDVRFGRESIRRLVTAMLTKKKRMISVVPQRFHDSIAGAFVQPMRYWWELVLPRKLFSRPPVLSSCWLIYRRELLRLGSFASVSRSIIPEGHFAREMVKTGHYSFLRSDAYLGLETQKSSADQRQTAVRLRYPQVHQRMELAFLLIGLELLLFLGPFVICAYGLFIGQSVLALIAVTTCLFLICIHVAIIWVTSPPSIAIGLIGLPIAIITEIYLSVSSMLRYEFGTVTWKDRTINPPRLQVIQRLPKIS